MRNHDEKIKDMVESVLPSTRRQTARTERRIVHKKQRTRQRDMLRNMAAESDRDFREGRRLAAISNMVWDRRAADNVGALVRWARAVVERDPVLAAADWPRRRRGSPRSFPRTSSGSTPCSTSSGPSALGGRMRGCAVPRLGRSTRPVPRSRPRCAASSRPDVTPNSTSGSVRSTPLTAHRGG